MRVYLSMKVDDVKNRFRNRGDKRERIDDALPMNLRIGSRVQISEAPFLLTSETGQLKFPGEESLIGAFSKVSMAGLSTARFYLKDRENPDEESMLMITEEPKDSASNAEMYLFRELEEIPLYHVKLNDAPNEDATVNTVDFWIEKNDGIIGMPLFHTPDELTYERLWEPTNDNRISGAEFTETLNLDPFGEQSLKVEHLCTVLYARTFEGLAGEHDEFLLPTVERDEEGFRVRIWVGMSLSQGDVTFPDAL